MSHCVLLEKAALIITKLQLIGAEPEVLTVNSLDFFFFFSFLLALKMRRQGVAKQAFFPEIYETNKQNQPPGNDPGSLHSRTLE